MSKISVSIVDFDELWKVRLAGEVDLFTAWQLREALETITGELEIDCAELEFIAGAGLAVLARLDLRCGRLVLKNVRPIFHRLLEIAGMAWLCGEQVGANTAARQRFLGADVLLGAQIGREQLGALEPHQQPAF